MSDSYHFKIGDFQCWAINDGDNIGTSDFLFVNAKVEELDHVLKQYELTPDHIPSTLTCLLIKTPTNLVLIDTGMGPGEQIGGRLLPILASEGFHPQDIDTVILSHVHPDHINGVVDEIGQLTFPQAAFYIWQDEWDFWTTESTLQNVPQWAASTARQKLPPLADHLKKINEETEIVPGVRVVRAPGHTVGHIAVEIQSQGEILLDIVDAALHPIQVIYPEWTAAIDQDPQLTAATRHSLYQRAMDTNALVLGFHFPPFPSLGRITMENGRYRWTPLLDQ